MSAVERAAEVIARFWDSDDTPIIDEPGASEAHDHRLAQALAGAGLLLSDADRAVLDAADAVVAWWDSFPGDPLAAAPALLDSAVRARRDQP